MTLDPNSAADFRKVMASYATGVVVVTLQVDGVDHAMTANSFTSVSLAPPLVLVCVERASRFDEALAECDGTWAVSVLGEANEPAARWFATKGRPLAGQFDEVPHHRGENGALLIDGALAHLQCRTEAVYRAGDHDILLGRVTAMAAASGADRPLLYYGSSFRAFTER